jgi:1-acyl-sn-glycerol-3-phosphate acyltransferase
MGRRWKSIPGLFLAAIVLTIAIPVWVPVALVVDALRGRFRFPVARLLTFGVMWAWLETAGVVTSAVFWLTGRRRNVRVHYALQRWWAARLMTALKWSTGLTLQVDGIDQLRPGPVMLFARHASLADSLVSAYVTTSLAGLNPRYVLKKELLADPCLDVVGQRLPNHFLDREAADSAPELKALEDLVAPLDVDGVGVIFPEGTRANPTKRERSLERIAVSFPARAERLSALRHLLPPRTAGAAAMLRGHPTADVVMAWHVGFEGLDTFGGILRALAKPIAPIRLTLRRVPRTEVPPSTPDDMEAFVQWLDHEWLRMDREVDRALTERNSHG